MGSDDLFKKRKAKNKKDLSRNTSFREENKKILIVCEGEKTEPKYFCELISHYRISTADVVIDGSCGSAPSTVFDYAKKKQDEAVRSGDAFDEIYCVFDRDSHSCYNQTVSNIKGTKNKKGVFTATTSIPCFEFWLILHYKYTDKPYYPTQNKSIGDLAEKDLKKFYPQYKKGMNGVFYDHLDQLNFAISNANKIRINNNSENPSTLIHELVECLMDMGK